MKKIIFGIALAFVLSGCSSAKISAVSAWGHKHKVELISSYDGHVIKTWETSGKIENEDQSDGIYFTDDSTGKLVALYGGPVVVEVE